jgi:hypothetical protein
MSGSDVDALTIDQHLIPEAFVVTFDDYVIGPYEPATGGTLEIRGALVERISNTGTSEALDRAEVYLTGDRAEAANLSDVGGRRLRAVLAVDNFLGTGEQFYGFAVFAAGEGSGTLSHVALCPDSLLHRQYEALPAELGTDELTPANLLAAISARASEFEPDPSNEGPPPAPGVFASEDGGILIEVEVTALGTARVESNVICLDQPDAQLDGEVCAEVLAAGNEGEGVDYSVTVPLLVDPSQPLDYWLADEALRQIERTRGSLNVSDLSLGGSRVVRLEVVKDAGDPPSVRVAAELP